MARGRAARRALVGHAGAAADARRCSTRPGCGRRSSSRGSTPSCIRTRCARSPPRATRWPSTAGATSPGPGSSRRRSASCSSAGSRASRRSGCARRLPAAGRRAHARVDATCCASSASRTARPPATRSRDARRARRAAVPLGARRRVLLPAALRRACASGPGRDAAASAPSSLRRWRRPSATATTWRWSSTRS